MHYIFITLYNYCMKIISFVTQKGGSGKTTLVLSCAVMAQEHGQKVLIIDTDPQGTAKEWYYDRPDDKGSLHLVSISTGHVKEAIDKAKKAKFNFVFIDTPGRDTPGTKRIVSISDFVLIPCRPAVGDLRAAIPSVTTIQDAGKIFAFVVNQSPHQPKRGRQAIEKLQAIGVVCPVPIVYRTAYQDAQLQGLGVSEFEPRGRAQEDIAKLWQWIRSTLNKL